MYNGVFQRNTGGTSWRKWLLIGGSVLGVLALLCCLVFLNSSDKPEPTELTVADIVTTQPTTAPATQPTTAPATAPTTVPITEPSTEPTTAPTTEPTTVPTTAPTTQPTTTTQATTQTQEQTEPPAQTEPERPYSLTCRDYFVYDVTAGKYLLQSAEGNTRLYPASITKLFTIYVALQYMEPSMVVTVGSEITFIDPDSTTAGLQQGDTLTVTQLAQGMLLPSGNDAAYALAAAAGRVIAQDNSLGAWAAVEVFVEEMNRQAQALGMTGTKFGNPDGIHEYGHYFSMNDMVTLGTVSLNSPLVRQIASTPVVEITLGDRTVTWKNTNAMVHPGHQYYNADVVGLKTGRTTAAGYCVLEAVAMEDRVLLIGVFGATEKDARFADAAYLLDKAVNPT